MKGNVMPKKAESKPTSRKREIVDCPICGETMAVKTRTVKGQCVLSLSCEKPSHRVRVEFILEVPENGKETTG